jgi:D-3-phosphoglycerate dehydrogenase
VKIAILDDYQDVVRTLDAFRKLDGHEVVVFNDHTKDVDELGRRLAGVEAIVMIRERTPMTAALLERVPSLRIISQNSVFPHIDVAACSRHGVIVSSAMHARPSYATAELTWALILAAWRHLPEEIERFKRGDWQRTVGIGLRGKTLGIYGYGRIGATVAGYGRAFGMKVLVWARESSLANARADGYSAAPTKQALFEDADVVTVHLRLVGETREIVTRPNLLSMKPHAMFVNTSRAGLVEEGALVEALRAGRPGYAAVDVFEDEPVLGGKHPLLGMPNVVCTPHLGYVERDGYEFYFSNAFDQILAYAKGAPINVANPEAIAGRASPGR